MQRGSKLALTMACAGLLAVAGCATGGSGGSAGGGGEATAAKPGPPRGVAPPAGSRMAKVTQGMSQAEVRELMGEPTSEDTYQTGKAWIPWYFGSDTMRTDYKYKGQGRIVFGINRYSGNAKVIRIDYDPSEDGQ